MAVGKITIGIIIGIIGQAISAVGLILQKRAHANIEADKAAGKTKQKKWYLDVRWWVAFIIFFSGNLCQVGALTLATQSIISALVVLVLVFNAILAPFLLKGETLQKIDVVGVIIIIAGVIFVVIWGPHNDTTFTSDELLRLWINTPFAIYGLIILGVVIILIIFNHIIEKKRAGVKPEKEEDDGLDQAGKKKKRHHHDKSKIKYKQEKEHQVEQSPDVIARREKEEKKKRDAPPPTYGLNTRFGKFVAACYAVLPAILSSFNALFSKILGEVVYKTADGDDQFVKWPTYLFFVLFVVVDATQVVYLQRALRSYSALYIIPLYQVSLTVFGVATGGIYFQEFNSYSGRPAQDPTLFVIGILTAVSGVVVLSKRKPTDALPVAPVESEKDSKAVEEGVAASTATTVTTTPEGIMSTDPDKDAPPVNFGTILVFAVLSGTKWYLKQGEIANTNTQATATSEDTTASASKATTASASIPTPETVENPGASTDVMSAATSDEVKMPSMSSEASLSKIKGSIETHTDESQSSNSNGLPSSDQDDEPSNKGVI